MVDFNGHKIFSDIPRIMDDYKEIIEYNFLGLSNTAINLNKIKFSQLEEMYKVDIRIFDWYLFSYLLWYGLKGNRVDKAYTMYRIHSNNIAGIQNDTIESLKYEIEVKIEHYNHLKHINSIYLERYN